MNRISLYILLCLLAFPLPAAAGCVNLTGAENARSIAGNPVGEDSVTVVLEIFVRDLDRFIELIPDEFFRREWGKARKPD